MRSIFFSTVILTWTFIGARGSVVDLGQLFSLVHSGFAQITAHLG